jgi:peptidoglycan L-alanyl-D-glutamate endopeptidase CwlK
MPYKFSAKSLAMLSTAHPDLQRLMHEVLKHTDICVIEGHREETRQNALVAAGFSKTKWPNSRHNTNPSTAVDITPNPVNWKDKQAFVDLACKVKEVAVDLGIEIEWGGDFKGFFDGPHYQLKQKKG